MLGFDSSYGNNRNDEELARISHDEGRVLLTRDTGLLKRSAVVYGYFVRATEPKRQVIEVLRRYDSFSAACSFTRCVRCNALLNPVPKETVIERLQPKTRHHYDEFRICPDCNRIYWAGSHYEHMRRFVERILAE